MTAEAMLKQIALQLDDQFPFVAYRKANDHQLKVLLQRDARVHTHTSTDQVVSGFIFSPFDDTQHPTFLIPLAESIAYTVSIEKMEEEPFKNAVKPNTILPKAIQQQHIDIVTKAITAIGTSSCDKIVVSRKEVISIKNTDTIAILKRLLIKYPKAFVYCWYHPKVGLWLGATPETLLTIKKNHFFTMALAGTQAYDHTNDREMVWGQKEVTEQRMVSDYIVKGLNTITPTITCSETYTHRAGTVAHLRTDISGRIPKNTDSTQIIKVLHPTPAVCGLPQQDAKAFIMANEGYDRKFYTGFLGMLQKDEQGDLNADLFVNLRCIEIISDTAVVYVGGGITKDSDPEKEWQETIKKSETMKSVL